MTNLLTHEVVKVRGSWQLHFSEDGHDGRISTFNEQTEEVDLQSLQEVFSKWVAEDGSGELKVVSNVGGKRSVVVLADITTPFKAGSCIVSAGVTAAEYSIPTFVFVRPRAGKQRVFWCVAAVGGYLKVDSYKGNRGKWVQDNWLGWNSMMEHDLGNGNLVLNTHTKENGTKQESVPWNERCLPETSVSTVGLLWLVCRWCWLSPGSRACTHPTRQLLLQPFLVACSFA